MSFSFVPHGVYEDIINIVGQWKIVDMKSLKEMCNYDVGYFNLLKKVRTLESHGLVKGVLLGRKNKHIYLTNNGLKYTGHDYTYEICDENLTHDLIVGRVLKELLKHKSLIEGRMFHQISEDQILPDAEVNGVKNDDVYRMALEVELTQKSQKRVKEKYRRYAKGSVFTYGVFITNKESLFKTYRRYLEEMNLEVQEANVLILAKEMSATKFDYNKTECFYLGETLNFESLFGEGMS
ncbi:MAG: hypothetical protein CMJ16_08885 [Peredibacter sp.]|nr:hypothetical protein [Peredibacter sp.]